MDWIMQKIAQLFFQISVSFRGLFYQQIFAKLTLRFAHTFVTTST